MLRGMQMPRKRQTKLDSGIYSKWERGPSKLGDAFPLAVWVQSTKNSKRYREAGINLYVGLWRGPTEEQLAELKAADMHVICSQRDLGLNSANADVIVGWMHGDEPDNADPWFARADLFRASV